MTARKPQAAPVDYADLLARCQGNLDFAERLLARFEQRLGSDLDQLQEELEQRDAAAVARVAHRLRGACANVAAKPLERMADQIEHMSRHERLEELPVLMEELRREQLRIATHTQALISAGSE